MIHICFLNLKGHSSKKCAKKNISSIITISDFVQSVSVPDIGRELGQTMCRARVDTDSDSIDCSVDVVGEEEGGSSYGHRYDLEKKWLGKPIEGKGQYIFWRQKVPLVSNHTFKIQNTPPRLFFFL